VPSLRPPERAARTRRQEAADNLRARGPDLLARVLGDASDEQLERRFGNRVSQRALFSTMAHGFRPQEAYGFRGEIGYEVVGGDGHSIDHWTLEVTGRRARAKPRRPQRPATSVRLRLPTLIRLAAATVNPTEAMLNGEIAITGDLELAGRLTGMFGGKLPDIARAERDLLGAGDAR
jgi:ubiquinone biosynthesis protein UbiJ